MALNFTPQTRDYLRPASADDAREPEQIPTGYFIGPNGQLYYPYDPAQWAANSGHPVQGLINQLRPQIEGSLVAGPNGQQYIPASVYDAAAQQIRPYVTPDDWQHSLGDALQSAPVAAALLGAGAGAASLLGGAAAGGAGAFDAAGVGALGSADAAAAGLGGIAAPVAAGAAGAVAPLDMGAATGAFDMGGVGAAGSADAVASGLVPGLGQAGAAAAGAGLVPSGDGFTIPGTNTTIPWNVLAGGIQALGGWIGAGRQADAYKDVAAQQGTIGAPFRDLLMKSYQPGFDLMSQPGYGDAFSKIADISTRGWSGRGVNPSNNPGAQAAIQSDVWNQGYLPALSNYRGGLGQFGGMGLNTSGAASLAGAGSVGDQWEAIGAGVNTALNPQPNWADIYKQMAGGKLTIGGNTIGK